MNKSTAAEYHKELFDHFGFNFGFVADLLEKYFDDSDSVSDYWKSFFDQLTGQESTGKQKDSQVTPTSGNQSAKIVKPAHKFELSDEDEPEIISGVGAKIIANMDASLDIPTATSLRTIPVKLLEENRRLINIHLQRMNAGKLSFTHIVAYAIVQSLRKFPTMNNSFAVIDGKPHLIKKPYINFGLAVDTARRDGSRSLIVPNIKKSGKLSFSQFVEEYNNLILRVKKGQIEPSDFQGSTITLTNPGGIGTVSSTPRLMQGQGCIIAVGAIDYPAEFKAMHPSALAELGCRQSDEHNQHL